MSDPTQKIAIDDLVEAATAGVFRAMEARSISAADFTAKNGFHIKIDITAGGYPDSVMLGRQFVPPAGEIIG